jgi:hypothetical protein
VEIKTYLRSVNVSEIAVVYWKIMVQPDRSEVTVHYDTDALHAG